MVTQSKSGKKEHMTKQKKPRLPNADSLLSNCMKQLYILRKKQIYQPLSCTKRCHYDLTRLFLQSAYLLFKNEIAKPNMRVNFVYW